MSEENQDDKSIYEMQLHDVITVEKENTRIRIIRVPGGWIYGLNERSVRNIIDTTSIFVPYDNEFHPLGRGR